MMHMCTYMNNITARGRDWSKQENNMNGSAPGPSYSMSLELL